MLQGSGIGNVAGGTGGEAVAPADNAGKIGLHGFHIGLIGLLNGLQILLPGNAQLLPLAGTFRLQQLVLRLDLSSHMNHCHQQPYRRRHQQQENNDITNQCLSSFIFPHSVNSPK